MRDDFPVPLTPRTPTRSPGPRLKLTSFRITRSPNFRPIRLALKMGCPGFRPFIGCSYFLTDYADVHGGLINRRLARPTTVYPRLASRATLGGNRTSGTARARGGAPIGSAPSPRRRRLAAQFESRSSIACLISAEQGSRSGAKRRRTCPSGLTRNFSKVHCTSSAGSEAGFDCGSRSQA